MTTWNFADALSEVRLHLWRFLSGSAHPSAIASSAEGLWDLPSGEIRRLIAAHLVLSEATENMLMAAALLLPRIPADTRLAEEELLGRVHGPVDWQRTRQLQLSSGDRRRFLCLPPDRHFDTALARLIKSCLTDCLTLGEAAALRGSAGPVRTKMERTTSTARRLVQHTKLRQARKAMPTAGQLVAIGARRHTEPLLQFARAFSEGFVGLEPAMTRTVIEEQLLAPADDETLFELLVGCRLTAEFEAVGFVLSNRSLIEPGGRAPLAVMRRGSELLRIWWQRSALPIAGLKTGLYAQCLLDAGIGRASLRPDFVLEFATSGRVVLVEVKHTVSDAAPVHAGVKDALLYLMDARDWFDAQPFPHAVVVAFGADSCTGGRVIVSGERPDQIRRSVRAVVEPAAA